ncbi:hypothetical protein VTK56DRAFT_7522 [Thermocarpiscus australiensis]
MGNESSVELSSAIGTKSCLGIYVGFLVLRPRARLFHPWVQEHIGGSPITPAASEFKNCHVAPISKRQASPSRRRTIFVPKLKRLRNPFRHRTCRKILLVRSPRHDPIR